MQDEEDIFVGDVVTCILKVVHENLLPENVSAKDVAAGVVSLDESENESDKEEEENPKRAMTIDELEATETKRSRLHLSPGIVYSKQYEFESSDD